MVNKFITLESLLSLKTIDNDEVSYLNFEGKSELDEKDNENFDFEHFEKLDEEIDPIPLNKGSSNLENTTIPIYLKKMIFSDLMPKYVKKFLIISAIYFVSLLLIEIVEFVLNYFFFVRKITYYRLKK